ncbi:unnamed protein product [Paramecium sonneborni]|uniref:Uncharacterized protein n=1 Tax=Paramecium sonneborni TaxID=65129 RepID=A0A8S1N6A5_9CILI|nr:unnamed protein product [Paramecium sonneborni]
MLTIIDNKNQSNRKMSAQLIIEEFVKSKENHQKQKSQEQILLNLPKKLFIHKQQFNDIQENLKNRKSKQTQEVRNRLFSPINSKILNPPKSKSIQEKKQETQIQIDLKSVIPQSSKTLIDWMQVIKNINCPKDPLKKWIRDIIIKNKIIQDYDFAILIRILMQLYKLKQATLVNLFSEIIEELEI